MGRLIYGMNVTLDGFIETPEHDLSWGTVDDELHSWFNDRMRDIGASLYGRRLYEVMSGHWPTAESDPDIGPVELEFARIWNSTPRFVFSNTLTEVHHNSRLVRGDVAEILEQVRGEIEGDLEVGGANLAAQFIERGLVDEFNVVVHPVSIGGGTPFFPSLASPLRLRLTETKRFESGVVALTYVPA
jgi:dihydrofolate reductase